MVKVVAVHLKFKNDIQDFMGNKKKYYKCCFRTYADRRERFQAETIFFHACYYIKKKKQNKIGVVKQNHFAAFHLAIRFDTLFLDHKLTQSLKIQ